MPRILFVLHLPPPVHGASVVGKYIHDSEAVNAAFDCHYVNLTTAQSLEDVGRGGLRKLWVFARKLTAIHKAIKRIQPDMVYITPNTAGGPFYKDFVVVQLCKWWSGKKVLLHFHNKGVATRQDRWLDNLLYRQFFNKAEVILLGKPLYEDIRKYVPETRVHYCPNGIPYNAGQADGSDGRPIVPKILFLSNLQISKGVIVLMDALVILKERGWLFECDFVGGETSEMNAVDVAEEIKKRSLQECAIYHGRKYGAEKEAFYRHADIFCFPTFYHNECFPLVLLEAMLHGLPCVTTNEGAISCIIEQGVNGYLVERENAINLADALQLLLADKALRQRMGKAGWEKFEREFTLERFEHRFVEVLKDCVKSK